MHNDDEEDDDDDQVFHSEHNKVTVSFGLILEKKYIFSSSSFTEGMTFFN